MSATHKPGSVAMATADGCGTCPSLAVKDPTGATQRWFVWGHGIVHEGLLTSIAPCVVLEGVTRADADALESWNASLADSYNVPDPLIARIAAAIREQTPEPEPEPRYTVSKFDLFDRGRAIAWFTAACPDAQAIADALNAADKEQDRG